MSQVKLYQPLDDTAFYDLLIHYKDDIIKQEELRLFVHYLILQSLDDDGLPVKDNKYKLELTDKLLLSDILSKDSYNKSNYKCFRDVVCSKYRGVIILTFIPNRLKLNGNTEDFVRYYRLDYRSKPFEAVSYNYEFNYLELLKKYQNIMKNTSKRLSEIDNQNLKNIKEQSIDEINDILLKESEKQNIIDSNIDFFNNSTVDLNFKDLFKAIDSSQKLFKYDIRDISPYISLENYMQDLIKQGYFIDQVIYKNYIESTIIAHRIR